MPIDVASVDHMLWDVLVSQILDAGPVQLTPLPAFGHLLTNSTVSQI